MARRGCPKPTAEPSPRLHRHGRRPRGREILQSSARAVGIPENAYFIASDGSEYAPYRRFYETAPAQLR